MLLLSLASLPPSHLRGRLLRSATFDSFDARINRKKQQVWRSVMQLQSKRKMMSVHNKSSAVLADPDSIAAEIVTFWQQTTSVEGKPIAMCKD